MRIFKIADIERNIRDTIKKVAEIIKIGGLVIYPTETLYGLGTNALDDTAVQRVFDVKTRPIDKSISVAFSSVEHAKKFVIFNDTAEKLAKKFLPGPLTLILPLKPEFYNVFLFNRDSLGIRIPDDEIAQAILKEVKIPITATSANLSGGENPSTAEEAIKQIGDKVDLVLDAGKCKYGKPSTVVDCTCEIEILREGVISREKIFEILKA